MTSVKFYLNADLKKICEKGWCNPNHGFLDQVVLARGSKKDILIEQVGDSGLIIDVILRASIAQMIVLYFGADASQIIKNKKYLRKHTESFTEDNQIINQIAKWFACTKATTDFVAQYRSFRMSLLTSQMFTLLNAPKTLVRIKQIILLACVTIV